MSFSEPQWPRRLPAGAVLNLATLGPVGRRLPAPGTWGSAAGLVYFLVLFPGLGWLGMTVLAALGAYFAVGICGEAERLLGEKDPGEVILDEVAAMPLCFLGWGSVLGALPVWAVLLLGFGLFRLFDIAKPFGIRRLQSLPGGWGVVADDLAAALAACVVLHAGVWAWRI